MAQNNVRDVWRGLKNISGFGESTRRAADGDTKFANELNSFFTRFDSPHTALNSPHPSNPQPPRDLPSPPPPLPPTPDPSTPSVGPSSPLTVTPRQVRGQLMRLKQRKASGPDGTPPRLLKTCADELCQVLSYIYNLSLSLGVVPTLWKTSCVVPVPKTPHAREPTHFRPVTLTSHLMKTMERLVLAHLRTGHFLIYVV